MRNLLSDQRIVILLALLAVGVLVYRLYPLFKGGSGRSSKIDSSLSQPAGSLGNDLSSLPFNGKEDRQSSLPNDPNLDLIAKGTDEKPSKGEPEVIMKDQKASLAEGQTDEAKSKNAKKGSVMVDASPINLEWIDPIRDPFFISKRGYAEKKKYLLTATLIEPRIKVAVINRKSLKEGDPIDENSRLIKIYKDKVKIKDGSETRFLTMQDR